MQFSVCPRKEFSAPSEWSVGTESAREDVGEGCMAVLICVELQHKWEFLEAVWLNTSVSLAAVPAFHDSAFHHLKHVIAFDDNKRIMGRQLSTVSENTKCQCFRPG